MLDRSSDVLGRHQFHSEDPKGRLPDFLCLGVQKGGTTTLQRLLEQHPEVFLPSAKEVHYFSLHFDRGTDWYKRQFAPATPSQHCGEITPYYLFHPEVPDRVHHLLPQVRLIVLLRDPVSRALSHYFHSRRLGLESLPLDQALALEKERLKDAEFSLSAAGARHGSHQEHSYLSRSRYELQLPIWETLFPPAQLLVLRSEDLFERPSQIWSTVLDFLALPACSLPALTSPANAGRGEATTVTKEQKQRLHQQLMSTYAWSADRYGLEWG